MPKGVVLLLSVMIVGSVVLAMALAVSLGTVGRTTTTLHVAQAFEARTRAGSCFDEALIWFASDANWSATSVTTLEGTCTVTVANLGGNSRELTINASEDNVFYGMEVTLMVDPVAVLTVTETF